MIFIMTRYIEIFFVVNIIGRLKKHIFLPARGAAEIRIEKLWLSCIVISS